MARLNTRSQAKQDDSRERSRPQRLTERYVSPPPKERRRERRTMTTETLFDERPGPTEKPALGRSKSTRSRAKTVAEQQFDIFADSDGTTDRDTPKAKKATPLKLARTNSMMLPLPQQHRTRTSRKSELYNYDKENDPLEEELDPEPEPTSLSRNPSDASSTRRSPTRNRNTQQFTTYRQQHNESEDENGDDSLNSLDDFIVSDNDEPSYHETEDDETEEDEEEHKASPPPTQRRRLLRGRRPDPTAEIEKALLESTRRPDLRLEPSLPAAFAAPSPNSDRVARKLFQKDTDVSDKMDRLNLEDSDPSSQLQNDLFG